MRRNALVAIALVTVLAAQEAWSQQAPSREPSERETLRGRGLTPAGVLLSSTLIGARVKTGEGKDLGEIDQLMIEPKTGQVSHVVLGLGGLAGVGEAKVVVGWKDIEVTADPSLPYRTIARVDQAVVERAPRWAGTEHRDPRAPAASPPTMPSVPGVPVPRY